MNQINNNGMGSGQFDLKEVKIWNVKFNLLTAEEIATVVNSWLDEGKKGIHLTGVDACVMVQAQKDELLRKAILESDIVNVDSYLPAKKLAENGYDIKDRVTTPDVMEELFKIANEKEQKVFLFGAKENTVTRLRDVLTEEYPNMKIVGYRNGYYSAEEEPAIAEEISSLSPDFLFIGMPTPRKEHFMLEFFLV
jgi:N-acetylglucosaminyldiphosphoundecaprenol N-acetyl-beta-D-mannosaminyltransferase